MEFRGRIPDSLRHIEREAVSVAGKGQLKLSGMGLVF